MIYDFLAYHATLLTNNRFKIDMSTYSNSRKRVIIIVKLIKNSNNEIFARSKTCDNNR